MPFFCGQHNRYSEIFYDATSYNINVSDLIFRWHKPEVDLSERNVIFFPFEFSHMSENTRMLLCFNNFCCNDFV